MKKKYGSLLFCLLFLIICLLPLAGMLLLGPSEAGSNEVLTKAPALLEKDGRLNTAYLSEFSNYFADRFGFRQELITAHAKLTAAVFGESATASVILGDAGWLYYADTLADYEGTTAMSDRQIWNAARTLALMEEYAGAHGADFVFAAAPNKNTLYPDQMPSRYTRSEAPSNLQRLHLMLDTMDVAYCDWLTLLQAQPEPVYFKTDSHWTPYGSALAHDALMSSLGQTTDLAGERFTPTPHQGDLTDMLYPAAGETEDGPALQRERRFSYTAAIRGVDDMTIRTACADATGSLLMFRDSFGNTLHADLAESFAAACFSRAMPYHLTWLQREHADALVVEIVERNLVDLAEKAPLMEAPRRDLDIPEATVSAQVEIEVDRSTLEGCVAYTGAVICDGMDLDSPIYLVLDGVAYEATPAGETETSFTMYAPEAKDLAVLIQCSGQLLRIQGLGI